MAIEGLAYCLTQRIKGPKPLPGPSEKEVLDDLIKFCLIGFPDGMGGHIPDDDGHPMTGTINWLASFGHFTGDFYIAHQPTPMFFVPPMFFVSLADESNPWSELPGFMLFVRKGQLTLDLGKDGELQSKGSFILEPRPDLHKALADMQHPLKVISASNRARVLAALGGEKRSNLGEVLRGLGEEAKELSDLLQKRLAMFPTIGSPAKKQDEGQR